MFLRWGNLLLIPWTLLIASKLLPHINGRVYLLQKVANVVKLILFPHRRPLT